MFPLCLGHGMAMSLQIRPETSRGMARRAPNTTELFYEVFWIIKFSFLEAVINLHIGDFLL